MKSSKITHFFYFSATRKSADTRRRSDFVSRYESLLNRAQAATKAVDELDLLRLQRANTSNTSSTSNTLTNTSNTPTNTSNTSANTSSNTTPNASIAADTNDNTVGKLSILNCLITRYRPKMAQNGPKWSNFKTIEKL